MNTFNMVIKLHAGADKDSLSTTNRVQWSAGDCWSKDVLVGSSWSSVLMSVIVGGEDWKKIIGCDCLCPSVSYKRLE